MSEANKIWDNLVEVLEKNLATLMENGSINNSELNGYNTLVPDLSSIDDKTILEIAQEIGPFTEHDFYIEKDTIEDIARGLVYRALEKIVDEFHEEESEDEDA